MNGLINWELYTTKYDFLLNYRSTEAKFFVQMWKCVHCLKTVYELTACNACLAGLWFSHNSILLESVLLFQLRAKIGVW